MHALVKSSNQYFQLIPNVFCTFTLVGLNCMSSLAPAHVCLFKHNKMYRMNWYVSKAWRWLKYQNGTARELCNFIAGTENSLCGKNRVLTHLPSAMRNSNILKRGNCHHDYGLCLAGHLLSTMIYALKGEGEAFSPVDEWGKMLFRKINKSDFLILKEKEEGEMGVKSSKPLFLSGPVPHLPGWSAESSAHLPAAN